MEEAGEGRLGGTEAGVGGGGQKAKVSGNYRGRRRGLTPHPPRALPVTVLAPSLPPIPCCSPLPPDCQEVCGCVSAHPLTAQRGVAHLCHAAGRWVGGTRGLECRSGGRRGALLLHAGAGVRARGSPCRWGEGAAGGLLCIPCLQFPRRPPIWLARPSCNKSSLIRAPSSSSPHSL